MTKTKPHTDLMIDRAVKALIFIEAYKSEWGGNTPANQEIADHLGLKTERQARLVVDILEESGLIEVVKGPKGNRRWIVVKGARYTPSNLMTTIPGNMILGDSTGFNEKAAEVIVADQVRKELLSGLE